MFDIVQKLLEENNLSLFKLSKLVGVPYTTLVDWKNRKYTPKIDKIKKIADYFDVTVDYLMTGEEKENYYINPETAKIAQEIFENPNLKILFNASKNLQPEDLKAVITMVKALQRNEQK